MSVKKDFENETKFFNFQIEYQAVLDVHRNLPLKFHQNRVSNSLDIADIEFLWCGSDATTTTVVIVAVYVIVMFPIIYI